MGVAHGEEVRNKKAEKWLNEGKYIRGEQAGYCTIEYYFVRWLGKENKSSLRLSIISKAYSKVDCDNYQSV